MKYGVFLSNPVKFSCIIAMPGGRFSVLVRRQASIIVHYPANRQNTRKNVTPGYFSGNNYFAGNLDLL